MRIAKNFFRKSFGFKFFPVESREGLDPNSISSNLGIQGIELVCIHIRDEEEFDRK